MKWQDVKKLLIGSSVGIIALFSALFLLTGVEYEHSGDIVCGDTCESYVNVTTTYWRICFDYYEGTKYENENLFKKQTRSRTLHVNLDNVNNIITTEPEIEVDWLVPTYGKNWRPIKAGDCWERGKVNKIKLVGHKETSQTVKWSFDVGDKVNIDPVWEGEGVIEDREYIDYLRETSIIESQEGDYLFSYDSELKEILIEDSQGVILQVRLTTPYVNEIIGGLDSKVAELYLSDYDTSFEGLFDSYELYDVKNNYEPVNRTFRFKYGVGYNVTICVDDGEGEICKSEKQINWTEFTHLSQIPKDVNLIGIFTETYMHEKIEWVPIIKGIEIYQWAAWEVSTASFVQDFYVGGKETDPGGVFFKPDGTKMYTIGENGDTVDEYNLSMAWNISTAVYSQEKSIVGESQNSKDLFFKSDGTKMYIIQLSSDRVHEYNLSIAWNINSASDDAYLSIGAKETQPQAFFFNATGNKMYTTGNAGDTVDEYNLSTAWAVVSATYSQEFDVSGVDINPRGLTFKPDGTEMYVVGTQYNGVHQFTLSNAWDVTSASYTTFLNLTDYDLTMAGIYFKSDGSSLWMMGSIFDKVSEFSLGLDETPPYFTKISNQTLDNQTALSYDINASDETAMSCFVVNDTTNFKIDCDGILENNTQLTVQLYNINITINDTTNNINSSLMWVNVTEYLVVTQCNPTADQDWVISDAQVCDGVDVSTGTGNLIVISPGNLTLINYANVTATKVIVSGTGDQIFVGEGCELRDMAPQPQEKIGYEIFYEDFEDDWETTSTSACDSTPTISLIGNFNNADSNTNDFLWCATSESGRAHEGTYGLNVEDWDAGTETSTTGLWYNFDASTSCSGACDWINVTFWAWEVGMDPNEYCWVTEQVDGGTPTTLGTVAQPVNSYTFFATILSSGALSSSNVNVRVMCDMSSTGDETYFDELNITGWS